MKFINGQTELNYLLGALDVLKLELATSHNRLEVMERIYSIESCIIHLLGEGV